MVKSPVNLMGEASKIDRRILAKCYYPRPASQLEFVKEKGNLSTELSKKQYRNHHLTMEGNVLIVNHLI